MRDWSGCQIALFLDNGKDGKYNGMGLSARLYAGDVTNVDLDCVFPPIQGKGTLWKVTVTGEELLRTLEHAISVGNHQTGWFYYFSGLRMTYAPQARPGARVQAITLEDGSAIDMAAHYTVAVMENTVPADAVTQVEKTDTTVRSIVEEAIRAAGTISPAKDGRFTIGR